MEPSELDWKNDAIADDRDGEPVADGEEFVDTMLWYIGATFLVALALIAALVGVAIKILAGS
ncbi:MAG: hypothetical protein WDO56_26585 [Gammaproteobacteria bacterium]